MQNGFFFLQGYFFQAYHNRPRYPPYIVLHSTYFRALMTRLGNNKKKKITIPESYFKFYDASIFITWYFYYDRSTKSNPNTRNIIFMQKDFRRICLQRPRGRFAPIPKVAMELGEVLGI